MFNHCILSMKLRYFKNDEVSVSNTYPIMIRIRYVLRHTIDFYFFEKNWPNIFDMADVFWIQKNTCLGYMIFHFKKKNKENEIYIYIKNRTRHSAQKTNETQNLEFLTSHHRM